MSPRGVVTMGPLPTKKKKKKRTKAVYQPSPSPHPSPSRPVLSRRFHRTPPRHLSRLRGPQAQRELGRFYLENIRQTPHHHHHHHLHRDITLVSFSMMNTINFRNFLISPRTFKTIGHFFAFLKTKKENKKLRKRRKFIERGEGNISFFFRGVFFKEIFFSFPFYFFVFTFQQYFKSLRVSLS